MPPFRRRYPAKKKTTAPRRRRPALGKGKAAQNTKTELKATYRTAQPFLVASGSTVENYGLSYFSAMDMQAARYNGLLANVQDYRTQVAMYDEVKLTGFTVRYRPLTNTTDGQFLDTGVAYDANIYTWIDRDGSTITSMSNNVPQKIQSYSSSKFYNFKRSWSRHVKCATTLWVDTLTMSNSGGLDIGSANAQLFKAQGLASVIGIYCQNLPIGKFTSITPATNIGTLEVDWHVCFRGKKPVAFSTTEDGILTLTPSDHFAPIEATQPILNGVINDISGNTATLDASGNHIYVKP